LVVKEGGLAVLVSTREDFDPVCLVTRLQCSGREVGVSEWRLVGEESVRGRRRKEEWNDEAAVAHAVTRVEAHGGNGSGLDEKTLGTHEL